MKFDTSMRDETGTAKAARRTAWQPVGHDGRRLAIETETDGVGERLVVDKLDRLAEELHALGIQF